MDDLSSKINELLSDPESLKQIRELSSMLGGDSLHSENQPSPQPQVGALPDFGSNVSAQSIPQTPLEQSTQPQAAQSQEPNQNQLQNLLMGLSQNPSQQNQIQNLLAGLSKNNAQQSSPMSDLSSLMGGDSLSMITKLAPILGSLRKEDDTTRLLNAIRPFLSIERRKKLDEAEKMMKMMRLLPYFKDFSPF